MLPALYKQALTGVPAASLLVPAPPPPVITKPRVPWYFRYYGSEQQEFEAFTASIAPHFDTVAILFMDQPQKLANHIKQIMKLTERPAHINFGVVSSWLGESIEDPATWSNLCDFGRAVRDAGCNVLDLDLEPQISAYVDNGGPEVDLTPMCNGLGYLRQIWPFHLRVYPPNWQWDAGENSASMRTVLRLQRVLSAASAAWNGTFSVFGNTYGTRAAYEVPHTFGPEYRHFESHCCHNGGEPVQQAYLLGDNWWKPSDLRAVLPSIPYPFYLYVEPQDGSLDYGPADAQRLIECIAAFKGT